MNKKITKIPDGIFSFLLVIIPFLLIFLLLSPEIHVKYDNVTKELVPSVSFGVFFSIGFVYWLAITLLSVLFYYLRMTKFSFPFYNSVLALSFWMIMCTYPLTNQGYTWLRVLIIIISILLIIPTLILYKYLSEKRNNKFSKKMNNHKKNYKRKTKS